MQEIINDNQDIQRLYDKYPDGHLPDLVINKKIPRLLFNFTIHTPPKYDSRMNYLEPEKFTYNNIVKTIKSITLHPDIKYIGEMFSRCSYLESVPEFDTNNIINMSGLFYSCSSLKNPPLLNTTNVTDMRYMFSDCCSLEEIPLYDTRNVLSADYMFSNCIKLTSIPFLNLANVINIERMFYGCKNLQEIPELNADPVINMHEIIYNCDSLKKIPQFVLLNKIVK